MGKYTFIKQLKESDCGAACFAMIVKETTNINISLTDAENLIFSDEDGTSFSNIMSGLKKLGVNTVASKCNVDKVDFSKLKYPVITQISKGDKVHYIILYKYKKKKYM